MCRPVLQRVQQTNEPAVDESERTSSQPTLSQLQGMLRDLQFDPAIGKLGIMHADTVTRHHITCFKLHRLWRHTMALWYQQRALAICKAKLGKWDLATATLLNNVGCTLGVLGPQRGSAASQSGAANLLGSDGPPTPSNGNVALQCGLHATGDGASQGGSAVSAAGTDQSLASHCGCS